MPIVRECLLAIWRYRALGIACGLATLLLVGVAWTVAPRKYRSEAKLFVRVGKETVTLDPTATMGQTISIYEARETELNSVADVLGSRSVLELVVDRLGAETILGRTHVVTERAAAPAHEPLPASPATEPSEQPEPGVVDVRRPPVRTTSLGDELSGTDNPSANPARADDAISRQNTGHDDAASSVLNDELKRPAAVPFPGLFASRPTPPREQAIRALQKMLSVYATKKSGVMTISCLAGDASLAQQILQATLDAFQQEHIRIHRTSGSYRFFVEQVDLARTELDRATEQLRTAKDKLGLASVEGQRKFLQDKSALIETARLETEMSLVASQASVKLLKESITALPGTLVTQETTGFPNDGRERLRQQVQELELKEQDLLSRYTERHPQVIAVRQQLLTARALTAPGSQPDATRQSVQAINPQLQTLQLKLADEESKVASLLARQKSLLEQAAGLQKQLSTLNAHEGEISLLEQQVLRLQASHKSYAEKMELARVDQALQDGRISNVNIVQPATWESNPASPNSKLILLLGIAVAAANSIVIPLIRGMGLTWYRQTRGLLLGPL